MSRKASQVGDLIQFVYEVLPPDSDPDGVETSVQLFITVPGTTTKVEQAAPTSLGSHRWLCTADDRCRLSGSYKVQVISNGLEDGLEFDVKIAPSRFATPLP